jgi:hypothetical protein
LERGSREQLLERGSDAGHSAQSSDSGVPMVGQLTYYSRSTIQRSILKIEFLVSTTKKVSQNVCELFFFLEPVSDFKG